MRSRNDFPWARRSPRPGLLYVALTLAAATACSSTNGSTPAENATETTVADTASTEPTRPDATTIETDVASCSDVRDEARPDVTSSGNRLAEGSVDLTAAPRVVDVGGRPTWVLPYGDDGTWYVQFGDGTAVTVAADGVISAIDGPAEGESPIITTNADGSITIGSAATDRTLFDDPLPDTSVVRSGSHVAALVEPTDRYAHGVLGDKLEAAAVEIIDLCTDARVRIDIETPSVIEGISPLLADIDGDGAVDVLVTTSNGDVGARLEAYRLDGSLLALSEPIGRGNRWRNQLGVAPLGPNGEIEVIDVRIPHIGGIVEFFRLEGDQLVIHTSATVYTSHVLGSRNLDMAILADTTGDDRPEVIVFTQDRSRLAALSRTPGGVEELAVVQLDGVATTNIATRSTPEGTSIAVATSSGLLHVWGPTS